MDEIKTIQDKRKIIELENKIRDQYENITGVVILKGGRVIYENYFGGYTQNDSVHIASVTKSIISALIGIAIDKGYIKNANQKILEFFPEYKVKRGEKTIQQITIKNLLTMTAPYKYKSEPYTKVYSSDDWTKAALDLIGGKENNSRFKYTTIGIHILSAIIVASTGKPVSDFAKENLFEPLGIKSPEDKKILTREDYFSFIKGKKQSGWVVDPKGINTGGWGLTLTTRDLSLIGKLYLDNGVFDGRQIISKDWIEDSTKRGSRYLFGAVPATSLISYGYLWWLLNEEHFQGYAALGDYGNSIIVNPEEKLVISITASFKPRAKDIIELIRKI